MAELLDDHVFDLSARAGVRSLQPLGQLLGPHGDSQVTNSLGKLLGRCQLLHACLAFKQGANTSTAQARVANLESKLVRLLVDLAGTNLDAQDVERAAATVNDELAETREALAALERGSIARELQREWWEQFVRVEKAFVNTDLPSPTVKWSDLPQKWWDAVEATKDDPDALLQSGAATNTVERIGEFLSLGDSDRSSSCCSFGEAHRPEHLRGRGLGDLTPDRVAIALGEAGLPSAGRPGPCFR